MVVYLANLRIYALVKICASMQMHLFVGLWTPNP